MRGFYTDAAYWAEHYSRLTWDEDQAMWQCMRAYYVTELPLPLDPERLFKLTGASLRTQQEAVLYVLGRYWKETPRGYTHPEFDKELKRGQGRRAKGEESAAIRWGGMRLHAAEQASEESFTKSSGKNAGSIARGSYKAETKSSEKNAKGNARINAPSIAPSTEQSSLTNTQGNTNTKTLFSARNLNAETAQRIHARAQGKGFQNISETEIEEYLDAGYSELEFASAMEAGGGHAWAWVLARVRGRRADAQQGHQNGPGSTIEPAPLSGYYAGLAKRS